MTWFCFIITPSDFIKECNKCLFKSHNMLNFVCEGKSTFKYETIICVFFASLVRLFQLGSSDSYVTLAPSNAFLCSCFIHDLCVSRNFVRTIPSIQTGESVEKVYVLKCFIFVLLRMTWQFLDKCDSGNVRNARMINRLSIQINHRHPKLGIKIWRKRVYLYWT